MLRRLICSNDCEGTIYPSYPLTLTKLTLCLSLSLYLFLSSVAAKEPVAAALDTCELSALNVNVPSVTMVNRAPIVALSTDACVRAPPVSDRLCSWLLLLFLYFCKKIKSTRIALIMIFKTGNCACVTSRLSDYFGASWRVASRARSRLYRRRSAV